MLIMVGLRFLLKLIIIIIELLIVPKYLDI